MLYIKRSWLYRFRRHAIVRGIASVILLIGVGVGTYYGWMAYQRYSIAQNLPTEHEMRADPAVRQSAEGRGEAIPDEDFIASYKAKPEHPQTLTIDKLGVYARTLPMGVNPDNSMQAPVNIFDSGWYTEGALPGQEGAVVVDAHASGPTRQGLFAYLDTLQVGDTARLKRGDGQNFNYRVVKVETVPLADIDMQKVLQVHGDAKEGLNLITCAGEWLKGQSTYDKRVVVYTERI